MDSQKKYIYIYLDPWFTQKMVEASEIQAVKKTLSIYYDGKRRILPRMACVFAVVFLDGDIHLLIRYMDVIYMLLRG